MIRREEKNSDFISDVYISLMRDFAVVWETNLKNVTRLSGVIDEKRMRIKIHRACYLLRLEAGDDWLIVCCLNEYG